MTVRKKIFDIIDPRDSKNPVSKFYNMVMLLAIIVGLLPMMFVGETKLLIWMDIASCFCYIVDYVLRWITADFHSKRRGAKAFLLYPFTFMAIMDMLSILPTLSVISPVFRVIRISRLFKILRIIKFIRYFEPLEIIVCVIRKQRAVLVTVLSLAVFYTFITALIMFNAEYSINPETGLPIFTDFFDAFYWAACTLTTVGYGDIYPVSDLGRTISMISALVGIAIIALPSGIITAGYIEELNNRRNSKDME